MLFCLKSVLPLFEICSSSVRNLLSSVRNLLILFVSLPSLQLSHSPFFALPLNFLSALGIWGKQDGTSNCAWGWRGQNCSSPALGSPQPPPGCHPSHFLSTCSLLTKYNIS